VTASDSSGISPAPRCLIVDDDQQVRHAMAKAVESQGLSCAQAGNGEEALALLERVGEVPLCITDIFMPVMDGVAFLRQARTRYPDMAVIMLTGVSEVTTAVECLQLGALDYLSKPVMLDEVKARVANALEKRSLVLQNRMYQQTLESRVRELDRRNRQSLLNGVEMLVFALEAKDAYTSGHSLRVKEFTVKTAVQLGFTDDVLAEVDHGSRLHDIGKIGIRETVLHKPGPLTPDEFEHVKLHTLLGERILQPFLAGQPRVLRIVRSHHERVDGTGFPDGLQGDAIPLEARIVAVADAYDAMTTNRAYRASRTPGAAVEELRRAAGAHFDADVVEAFVRAHPELLRHPIRA
jgi:response regulator RpfG family c-di-GMP phosphodiesterase